MCRCMVGGVCVYCGIYVYRLLECCGGGLCSVYMCGRWCMYVVCVVCVCGVCIVCGVVCVWGYEGCMYRVVRV